VLLLDRTPPGQFPEEFQRGLGVASVDWPLEQFLELLLRLVCPWLCITEVMRINPAPI
jgi:hypothetical protein